ncbi:hypothetical protein COU76_04520 [Candidatus Peregrinibacteria bacterium CG10_big_fil_rev_8_21_14_0_10_49_10]|nr:MAG: hypothetical protein COU76_04520 [Candidatus Peregrinibacteria bacterium CG10_big_fil_rev_8_21_14_0_10_49_10]
MSVEAAAPASEAALNTSAVAGSVELIQKFFSLKLGEYTVLEYTGAAFIIAGVVGLTRWAFAKAFGSN